MKEIKKTEVVKTPAANADPEASRSVTYSIAQIIKFVNSGALLCYIPNEMLNEAQKATKYEAIAKTIEKTNKKNDERYFEYIRDGNLWEAGQMVLAAAKAAGYTIEGYHGARHTFNALSRAARGDNTYARTSRKIFFATDERSADSHYPYGTFAELRKQRPKLTWGISEKNREKSDLYHLFIYREQYESFGWAREADIVSDPSATEATERGGVGSNEVFAYMDELYIRQGETIYKIRAKPTDKNSYNVLKKGFTGRIRTLLRTRVTGIRLTLISTITYTNTGGRYSYHA